MNEILNVAIGESIGDCSIGMKRADVWSLYRYPITSFYKTAECESRADDISNLGMHVHYDEEGKV